MQRSLDYGFRGYQVPRATRSSRGKCSLRKYGKANQACAFDLLATVAGKLLLEKETSPSNGDSSSGRSPDSVAQFNDCKNYHLKENGCAPTGLDICSPSCDKLVQQELLDEVKQIKLEVCDEEISDEGPLSSNGCLHQQICLRSNGCGGPFGVWDKCKLEVDMPQGERCERKRNQGLVQEGSHDIWGSEEPFNLRKNPPALISICGSDHDPQCIGRTCVDSLPVCREDVKLVIKDDDNENSLECGQPCSITMKGYRSSQVGDKEIRRSLSSKLLKESPIVLKDGILFKNDGGKGPSLLSQRVNHKRKRTQRCLPFKRRGLCEKNSSSFTSHRGVCTEGVSNVLDQHTCEATHGTVSRTDQGTSVKISIKSFKVPQILIEMPETATIGTLKRYVVEAVTSMLEGGVKVSILLQGGKIHDDAKMICETHISCSNELDGVDFMLEPNTVVNSSKPCSSDPCHPLSPQQIQPLNTHNLVSENSDITLEGLTLVGSVKSVSCSSEDSYAHKSTRPTSLSPKEETANSLASIPTPIVTTVDALAVPPVNCKPRHAELAQRRIRCPFSVSEVESLVKAVEKLGTGRWRDVKLLSFDNTKHRTYVDLKDKWKTLVHTAQISPHQRRGETVPQELLDRVLAAHAHWSQKKSKHQVKHQLGVPLLL